MIDRSWDGVRDEVMATLEVAWDDDLLITIEAAYAGDPAPASAPGRTDRLWEHEVVELFLAEAASREARYLELEFGPHGHWLALGFAGYRRRVNEDMEVDFSAAIDGERWSGRARVAGWRRAIDRVAAVNAYAIAGHGAARRYLAAHPAPAGVYAGPDFHRLEHFALIPSAP